MVRLGRILQAQPVGVRQTDRWIIPPKVHPTNGKYDRITGLPYDVFLDSGFGPWSRTQGRGQTISAFRWKMKMDKPFHLGSGRLSFSLRKETVERASKSDEKAARMALKMLVRWAFGRSNWHPTHFLSSQLSNSWNVHFFRHTFFAKFSRFACMNLGSWYLMSCIVYGLHTSQSMTYCLNCKYNKKNIFRKKKKVFCNLI